MAIFSANEIRTFSFGYLSLQRGNFLSFFHAQLQSICYVAVCIQSIPKYLKKFNFSIQCTKYLYTYQNIFKTTYFFLHLYLHYLHMQTKYNCIYEYKRLLKKNYYKYVYLLYAIRILKMNRK